MSTQILCVLSVPVAAQAVATAEAKGKVKGATVTCPNRLYIYILMLSCDAASILGMCSLFRNMYGYYMQSNARDTAKYSRTSQNSQN